MGVRFISLADDDTVVAIARNAERAEAAEDSEDSQDASPIEQPDGEVIESDVAETPGEEGTDE